MFANRSQSRSKAPITVHRPASENGQLTTDVNHIFGRFLGDSDEYYDRGEVDAAVETVKEWVACKEVVCANDVSD